MMTIHAAYHAGLQRTVLGPITLEGVGLHSGAPVTLTILPAPSGHGIVFSRTDKNAGVLARWDRVVRTKLCTVLANRAGVEVSTVEHLMAALSGCGIDNALVQLDGPEVPIMDGSSAPFVKAIRQAGVKVQDRPRKMIRILRPVEMTDNGRKAGFYPAPETSYTVTIDFESRAIGRQSARMMQDDFISYACEARTFGFLQDVEALRSMGLARGGSLDNAIVVDGDRVLNPEGLRMENEFVRHKILDCVGDLALAGMPIQGAYKGFSPGHEMNNLLLKTLFDQPDAWELIEQQLLSAVA